jgi:transposase
MDLRQRVMAALDEGESSLEVAARFGVHDSWVRKMKRRRDRTGSIAPSPHGGRRDRRLDATAEERIRTVIESRNDSTLQELRESLASLGIRVSLTSVWRAVARLGRQARADTARAREQCDPDSRVGGAVAANASAEVREKGFDRAPKKRSVSRAILRNLGDLSDPA